MSSDDDIATSPTVVSDAGPTLDVGGDSARTTPFGGSHSESRDVEPVQIGDRYQILGLIGHGGMGNVYRVRDLELDEIVALKTLRADIADDMAVARFRAEVKLARRVTHRNVARTYDIGTANGTSYLTMELVRGEALDRVLKALGTLSPARTLRIVGQVLDGLAAAHAAGVVHQDLKPANVLLDGERVVLSDFGIARALDASSASPFRFVGTPAYMSPEQVQGGAELDARADLYALGVMMFEMLTGALPFTGPTPMAVAMARVIEDPPELADDIPEAVRAIVSRLIQRERDDRYPSASEAMRDVESAQIRVFGSAGHEPLDSGPAPIARHKTVAVLPLMLRGSEEHAYLRDGLSEELIAELSMIRGLRVPSLPTVNRHAQTDPLIAGRQLGASVVVTGSFRVHGERLRVRLTAMSVLDGLPLWNSRFEGPTADLFSVVADAADAIAEVLLVDHAPDRGAITDPVTIDLYMRARNLMWKHWHGNLQMALESWEQVVERAPDDPRVLAGAATYFSRLGRTTWEMADRGTYTHRAQTYASRAIAVAPNLPEPYVARATLRWNDFDFGGSLADGRRALEIAPGYIDALTVVGRVLLEVGPLDEAIRVLQTAIDIDAHAYNARWELVRARALERSWSEVDRLLSLDVAEADHRWARTMLIVRTDLWRDEPAWLEEPIEEAQRNPQLAFYAPLARHVAEQREIPEFARNFIDGLDTFVAVHPRTAFVPFQYTAETLAYVGRPQRAADMVDKAIQHGLLDLVWLEHCAALDPLRKLAVYEEWRRVVKARVDAISNR